MASKKTVLPKVSFIIPTLNAEDFLELCLKSIKNQIYPKEKIEIIIADAGSTDKTISIAKKYKAKIINNPEILHEPGKTRASKIAKGQILFFTDSDNILSHNKWILLMIKPFIESPNIMGFLPQTIPAENSNSLDRYLGYICTDPFTWFTYGTITSGRDFPKIYNQLNKNKDYQLYKFFIKDPPLFGFSQGAGFNRKFKRDKMGQADDLLAGIKLIEEGGIIAYVPDAGVYHYHVSGFNNFIKKYNWRIKNNLKQEVRGMGLINRKKYFSKKRQLKMYLFVPYSLSIIFPIIDTLKLLIKYKDKTILWHTPACISLSFLILYQYIKFIFFKSIALGKYE